MAVTVQPLLPAKRRHLRSFQRTAGLLGPLTAVLAVGLWLVVHPRTPDLAAQFYRTWIERRFGFSLFDSFWYDGHLLPGYSLLFMPLAAVFGLRPLAAAAALGSTAIVAFTIRRVWQRPQPVAEVAFALAIAGDLWIGRLTYALGVTFALCGVAAALLGRGRLGEGAAFLAGLAAATTSPVAGLLVAAFGVGYPLSRVATAGRRGLPTRAEGRRWAFLCAGAVGGAFAIQMLFPEGGHEPFGLNSLLATVGTCAAVFVGAPPDWPELRFGAVAFALIALVSEIHTPMGSNVERLGVITAAPLTALALFQRRAAPSKGPLAFRLPVPLARVAAVVALGASLSWVVFGPITQTLEVVGEPGVRAAFYRPLERFLAAHHPRPLRIEVPFTRAHWEAALLARTVPLAGGWERQLAKLYNRDLEFGLTQSRYRQWLDQNGVSYVAVPDLPLDPSALLERRVIASNPRYLRLVADLPGWVVYKVFQPRPLIKGLGRAGHRAFVSVLGHTEVVVRVTAPGSYLLRLRYNPYLSAGPGVGLREGRDGFTVLSVRKRGRYTVVPTFSAAGAVAAVARFFSVL